MKNETFLSISTELQAQLEQKENPVIQCPRIDQVQADTLLSQWPDLYIMKITYCDDNPLYRLTDGEIRITSDDELKAEIRRQFSLSDDKAGLVLKNFKYLLYKSPRAIEATSIKPVAFKDEDAKFAWKRLKLKQGDITKITLKDIPEFDDFTQRCGDGQKAVILWIGSLLHKDSSRAQYLHIKGEGGDGKSVLCDALASLFGDRAITITANRLKETHFGPELEGARLAVFKDENNPGFFQGSDFKRLTGESTMTVNPKYLATRTINIIAKVLVTSNVDVRIPDAEADKRRLIPIEVQRSTATPSTQWRKNFIASAEQILAYCFKEYIKENKATKGRTSDYIEPPVAKLSAAIDRNYEQIEEIFLNHFFLNPKNQSSGILTTEAHEIFSKWLRRPLNQMDYKAIEKVLESYGSKKLKKHGGKRMYSGLTARDN